MARKEMDLQKVIFVTAYCPPHKSVDEISPAEHRFAMVDLAVKDYPYFESSRIEMEQGCPCYAGDTITALQKQYGTGWQIYFITGLDALLTILNWEKAKTYPGMCHFIAAAPPRLQGGDVRRKYPGRLSALHYNFRGTKPGHLIH